LQSQEIPAQQWGTFLDSITRRHEGETISIELKKADLAAQNEARDVRLVGISFDPKRSITTEIDVMVRNDANAHLMHAIVRPSHLRVARTDEGLDVSLQIESIDGLTTLVRFNVPTTPK
jgi:hypothetical protein